MLKLYALPNLTTYRAQPYLDDNAADAVIVGNETAPGVYTFDFVGKAAGQYTVFFSNIALPSGAQGVAKVEYVWDGTKEVDSLLLHTFFLGTLDILQVLRSLVNESGTAYTPEALANTPARTSSNTSSGNGLTTDQANALLSLATKADIEEAIASLQTEILTAGEDWVFDDAAIAALQTALEAIAQAAFDPQSDAVNIDRVGGASVADVDDFKTNLFPVETAIGDLERAIAAEITVAIDSVKAEGTAHWRTVDLAETNAAIESLDLSSLAQERNIQALSNQLEALDLVERLKIVIDLLEGDEKVRDSPEAARTSIYTKLRRGTDEVLLTKLLQRHGNNIDATDIDPTEV